MSKCVVRPEVDLVIEELLLDQDRFNTWLSVKPVSLFFSDEREYGT